VGAKLAAMDCAIGFSLHSGWAVAVAVGGERGRPTVVLRRQVELIESELPRQVFHAAQGLTAREAEQLVRQVERSARECAERATESLAEELAAAGHRAVAVALCSEPRDVPTDVRAIVANHTLIHSAEGELYREAVEAAAAWLGLPVLQVEAKRVPGEVADRLGVGADRQKALLDDLGRALGPPWRADHKQATLLAAVALADLRSGATPER
jgi:hypothetical protein